MQNRDLDVAALLMGYFNTKLNLKLTLNANPNSNPNTHPRFPDG